MKECITYIDAIEKTNKNKEKQIKMHKANNVQKRIKTFQKVPRKNIKQRIKT